MIYIAICSLSYCPLLMKNVNFCDVSSNFDQKLFTMLITKMSFPNFNMIRDLISQIMEKYLEQRAITPEGIL